VRVRKRSQHATLIAHHWSSFCMLVVKLAFLLGLLDRVLKWAGKIENQFCVLIAAFKLYYFSSLRNFWRRQKEGQIFVTHAIGMLPGGGGHVSFHRILPMLDGLITFAIALAFMSWTWFWHSWHCNCSDWSETMTRCSWFSKENFWHIQGCKFT
jgi:hypothetical protein